MVETFNFFEAILWAIFGCLTLLPGIQNDIPYRRWNLPLAIVFFAFAASDLWEIQTGEWYEPWQLAALKIGCGAAIGGFFAWLIRVRISKKRQR